VERSLFPPALGAVLILLFMLAPRGRHEQDSIEVNLSPIYYSLGKPNQP
jgi:hypothetical protein